MSGFQNEHRQSDKSEDKNTIQHLTQEIMKRCFNSQDRDREIHNLPGNDTILTIERS